MTSIAETAQDAVMWLATLTEADADDAMQTVIDRVVALLRRDQRMPRLAYAEWHTLFADIKARSAEELGDLITGKGDIGEATSMIIDAIDESLARKRSRKADVVEVTR